MRLTILIALSLLAPTLAQANPSPPPTKPWDLRGAKAYSNLCYDKASDDTNGLRIFVRRPGQHPRVVMQNADGAESWPVVGRTWTAGGRLHFEARGEAPGTSFNGEVRGRYLLVRSLEPNAKPFRLVRRDDSRGLPAC